MRPFLIFPVIILIFSGGCKKHGSDSSFPTAGKKVFVKSVKYWDMIPENSESVFIAEYMKMPLKIRNLFRNIPMLAPPVSQKPDTIIIYWRRPFKTALRGGIFIFPESVNISSESEYRGHAVKQINGAYYMSLLSGNILFTGKKNDNFMAVDIFKKRIPPGRFVYSDAASLTRYFKSSKIAALYLADLESHNIGFKSLKPLRAGVSMSFPLGWTVVKAVLVFGNTSEADASVTKIAALVKRFAGNPLLKDIPWMLILKPLSVHSEGNLVYVQWAEKTDTFLKILALVKKFIIKHSMRNK